MAKPHLCEVIAIATGKKTESKTDLTKIYQALGKQDLLNGLSRTYQPLDEDGEKFPSENKLVQVRVDDVLASVSDIMTKLFDIVVTQDVGNTVAKGDVVVDDVTILKDVPVTSLLFLEKQLTDLHTVFSTLPTLSPEITWTFDENRGCYVSQPVQTAKTKKVPFRFVKAEATDKHPAQVDVMMEDRVVGNWTKVDFSGALSAKEKGALIDRVRKLRDAVVKAREKANQIEVDNVSVGKEIFSYLLAPVG